MRLVALGMAAAGALLAAGCGRANEPGVGGRADELSPSALETLGRAIFFDPNLSTPPGVACASCHDPATGFADPRTATPTSVGSVPIRFGSRNSPTVSYAAFSPERRFNQGLGPMGRGVWEGGQNWDGKAATLVEQAKLPFLNPLEMANPNEKIVIAKVAHSEYAALFRAVCGDPHGSVAAFAFAVAAFDCIARAIAAYEATAEVNPFDSKYDAYLAGAAALSEQEARGLALFEGKGACARCHRSRPALDGTPPMFTSRHHANVGVPRNPDNPFYDVQRLFNPAGTDYVDRGTGTVVGDAFHDGRFKIPTLRNVALTAPYMHNGAFADLATVLRFYSTRDVPAAGWPAPEQDQNIIRADNLGNLGLTAEEQADIVAFLLTLTDGWVGPEE